MDFLNYVKSNKLLIIIISLAFNIILISISIYLLINKKECICLDSSIDNNNLSVVSNESNYDDFYVEIKGAVKKPGVYKFNSGSIVNDLINESGGFNKNAYTKNINLSKSLSKETVIYVYTNNEHSKLQKNNIVYITNELPCECKTYDISNCIDNGKSEIIASDKDSVYEKEEIKEESSKLININTASIEELQTLTGIGASKAKDIVSYRTNNGLFKEISEITNVSGIGEALYEKIKDSITI